MALKESTLRETFINNTFDDKIIQKQIVKTMEDSFEYSRQQQNESIIFDIFHLKTKNSTPENTKYTGDLYVDKAGRACFDINYDFIGIAKRELYRISSFYMKEINHTTLITRQDLFDKFPIILIDNHTISEFKVKILNDAITIILPFKGDFVLERTWNKQNGQYNYIDHTMQVMIIKSGYTSSFRTNLFQIESMGQGLFFNRVEKSMFDVNPYTSNGTYFAMVHTDTTVTGSKLLDVTVDGDYYVIDFDNETKTAVQGVYFTITLIFIEDLYVHTFFEGTEFSQPATFATRTGKFETNIITLNKKWDDVETLHQLNACIPSNNLLIMKRDKLVYQNGGYSSFDIINTKSVVKEYYPNIFQIDSGVTEGDVYKVYYFYKDLKNNVTLPFNYFFEAMKSKNKLLSFECLVQLYFFDTNVTQELTDFHRIINYKCELSDYSITDFIKNKSMSMNSLEYNIDTLKKYIDEDVQVLRDYAIVENRATTDNYFLYTKNIVLQNRARTSTDSILSYQKVFSVPMYLFMLQTNTDKLSNIRIFVDGVFVSGIHHDIHQYMEYIYIPQFYVTSDSFIEIEVFKDYQFSSELHFEDMDSSIELTLTDISGKCYPMFSDLTFINTKDHEVITSNYFHISRKNTEYIESNECPIIEDMVKKTAHSFGETFVIKPVENGDNYVIDNPISVIIEKTPSITELVIETTGPILLKVPTINVGLSDFSTKRYTRVFYNGRLLNHELYDMYVDEGLYIQTNFDCSIGDKLTIDVTPFQYTRIGVIENIATYITQPNVFDINLSGIITKPFDLDYFDLYLNGRKLSKDNVVEYDGFHILLTNISSYSMLEIYERSRDNEYFGIDFGSKKYYYSVSDLFNTFTDNEIAAYQLGIISEKSMAEHTIGTVVYNDVSNKSVNMYYRKSMHKYCFYVNEYIDTPFVNPNEKSINRDMLINLYGSLFENSVEVQDGKPALLINPDDIVQGDIGGEKWVYTIGNRGYDGFFDAFINVCNHGIIPGIENVENMAPLLTNLSLRSENTTLYFPPGDYYFNTPVDMRSSVNIIGSQHDTHFHFINNDEYVDEYDDEYVDEGYETYALYINDASSIKNISFHTSEQYDTVIYARNNVFSSIEYCEFLDIAKNAIIIEDLMAITISNNKFSNHTNSILMITERSLCINITIKDNIFDTISTDCICLTYNNEIGNLLIAGNTFKNSINAIRKVGQLTLINPVIMNNIFENITNALYIDTAYLLSCKNNEFTNISGYGINILNASDSLISGNTFNNSMNDITVLNTVRSIIHSNTINLFTGIAIFIDGISDVQCKYNRIESENVSNIGIKINSDGMSLINRNTLLMCSMQIDDGATGNTIYHKTGDIIINNSVLPNTITVLNNPLIVDVKMFGAIGDGFTDDTTAIISAINSLTNNSILKFPQGIYVVTSDITIANKNDVTIMSEHAIIQGHLNSITFSTCHNLEVKDLMFRDFRKMTINMCNNTDIKGVIFKNFKESSLIVNNTLENDFFFIHDSKFLYSGINEYYKNIGGTTISSGSDIRFQSCNIKNLFILECEFKYASGLYSLYLSPNLDVTDSINNIFITDNIFDSTAYTAIAIGSKLTGTGHIARNKIIKCGEINKTISSLDCHAILSLDTAVDIHIIGNFIEKIVNSCINGTFNEIVYNILKEPCYKNETNPAPLSVCVYGSTSNISYNIFLDIPYVAIGNNVDAGDITEDIIINSNVLKNTKTPAKGMILYDGTTLTDNTVSLIHNMIINYEQMILGSSLMAPKFILDWNTWNLTQGFGKPKTVISFSGHNSIIGSATKGNTIFTNCTVKTVSDGIFKFTENIVPGSTKAYSTSYFDLSNAFIDEGSKKLLLRIEMRFATTDTLVSMSTAIKGGAVTEINSAVSIGDYEFIDLIGFCEIDTDTIPDLTNSFGIRVCLENMVGGNAITVVTLKLYAIQLINIYQNIELDL